MGVSDSRQIEFLIKNISINLSTVLKSFCKIEYDDKISSGFLIKFFKSSQDFFCLMTNKQVISREIISQRKKITFYYDSGTKMKEIDLFPDERFIKDFQDLNIDATIIEIKPNDGITKDYFLIPPIDYMYNSNELLNKEVLVLDYRFGQLPYSTGKIKEIN